MRRSGVFCNQVSTNTPLATTLTVLEATDEALCSQHERATRVPIPSPVSALSGTPVCFALTSAVTTISRMLVHESVQAELLDILCERTAAIKIGDPLLPDTLLGPLVSEASTHHRRHHYTGARCTVHGAQCTSSCVSNHRGPAQACAIGCTYAHPRKNAHARQ